ncbi:metal-dependent hydrolase [Candidatus Nanohalobium constans]|uniref:Membrane-bound metal-dependent hydrolase n=1 Tax=Candidatus Nanohalobium constans TaxID=2565781 RepID=A0A5Q0UFY3_9ARCH|nr:metal-dependent hydrolase [Candidatus Nanohalobium constans]QGA80518.1 membrane-bound metal-dependent hydrolase [Candidatus Nanohalobium constans]
MLGRQHLMLSVASVSVVLAPFLLRAELLVFTLFFGVAIGSLIPDVDAPDAAVFHRDVRGLSGDFGSAVNNLVGPVLPVFGYSTKYLIYKPVVKLLEFLTSEDYCFEEKHRTFSHSVLGVFTMTVLTGVYLVPVLLSLELLAPFYLLAFLSAYMIGAFLHMLEDSCTKTGIAWNSPFSETRIKGQISTGKDVRKPRIFLYWLGMLTGATFYLGVIDKRFLSLPAVAAISVTGLGVSWLVFLKLVAKAEITS